MFSLNLPTLYLIILDKILGQLPGSCELHPTRQQVSIVIKDSIKLHLNTAGLNVKGIPSHVIVTEELYTVDPGNEKNDFLVIDFL